MRPSALRPILVALVALVAAIVTPRSSRAAIAIPICNEPGNFAHCPLGPAISHPDGTLEYVPRAATVDQFEEAELLTSGWIRVPSTASILLSAIGSSEIRAIRVPGSIATLFPVVGPITAEADGVALGTFAQGASIDFEALLGGGATSVVLTMGFVDPEFTGTPWLVAMREFTATSDPLAREPAHLLVAIPEPSSGGLLVAGIAAFAAAAGRVRGGRDRGRIG